MSANGFANPPTHVIEDRAAGGLFPAVGSLVISVATAADQFPQWGYPPRDRDTKLRAFWPTEDYFASALFTVVAQYASFGFTLKGPPRMVHIYQDMLDRVQFGGGWEALIEPFLVDYFTTSNGAFMEIVRADNNDPASPCVALNHLDSCRCVRTGWRDEPVIYIDNTGTWHRLKWFNVIAMCEMPSPIEEYCGIGHSALDRLLRSCQTERDTAVIKQEKAAGRFTRQIHLVSGVSTKLIEDALKQQEFKAESQGFLYVKPLVLASLDPTARVTKETIDLASTPEATDEKQQQEAYIVKLALAFGTDYQNLAPLSGGGMNSANQAKVATMRSRGKGPRLFMQKLQRVFNFHGILPRSVTFSFGEHDIAEEMEKTELSRSRALKLEILVRAGVITTEVARQMAVDDGDLDERYLEMMRESNATNEIIATSTEPVDTSPDRGVKLGMPGPKEPPKAAAPAGGGVGGAVARPNNSNDEIIRAPSQSRQRIPGGVPSTRGRV